MSGTVEGVPERAFGGVAEATVVGRAQDGDLIAFEQLLRHYQGPLFRLAYRLLGDRGEAEDALQDTMVQVWRKLPGLMEPLVFRSWVYQIMTRRCLSLLRTRSRRGVEPVEADELAELGAGQRVMAGGVGGSPAESAEIEAQLRGLNEVLAQLPEDQRVCWVLRELHELSYAEIAYAMNLSASTVRGRLARARQNLARGMDAWR
ncbi:RNA polymerase sigma factor [Microlunatus aurantiacus]|uniref:RNA polymerase sigma factor n=1 Tax=Microlunatus aurantiacus TaxID=446786 RepID=A0ABP7CRZ5_9ACTN